MPFAATWKDLEITILSKVRQRQVPYNITYMWNLKKMIQRNLFTNIDIENKLMVTKGETR